MSVQTEGLPGSSPLKLTRSVSASCSRRAI